MRYIALTAAIALVLIGCNAPATTESTTGSGTTTTGQATPASAKAERRDIVGYVLFPGTVDVPADAQAEIHPPYRAPVAKVDAKVGDKINRGQTLIELAIPDQKAAYTQSQENLKAAQTAYSSAEAQYGGPVRDAKRQLDQARAAEKAAREAAQSGDATALDQATQQRQAAEEALIQAQAAVKTNMLPYQQQLDAAKAALLDAKSGYKQTLVKSPISGTLVDLKAQPNQEVGADAKEVIARVVNYAAITIRALADTDHRKLLERGTHVMFAIGERGKAPIDGVVRRVRDVPGANGGPAQIEATIDFKNEDGIVQPGTVLRWVGVKAGDAKGVIAVPIEAVQKDATGKPIVKVLEGSDWKDHVVETGVSDGDWIEIKSGIKEGDTIQTIGKT